MYVLSRVCTEFEAYKIIKMKVFKYYDKEIKEYNKLLQNNTTNYYCSYLQESIMEVEKQLVK